MNGEAKGKKVDKPNKKVQLLLTFHRIIPFLHIFSEENLTELESIMHIFVFNRSSVLAKQNEPIDYLGVVIEGRAVRKGKFLDIGELIGWESLVGSADKHTQNIAAETDGLVLAIRLQDLLTLEKSKYNKIVAKCAELLHLRDKDSVEKLKTSWEELDERKATKYIPADWSVIFSEMEAREKNRFFGHFPIFSAKQKALILSPTCKPALIVLFSGQLTLKSQLNTSPVIISSPTTYNIGAFLSGTGTHHNIYCLSSECIFWILQKDRLEKVGGKDITRKIYEKIGEFRAQTQKKEEAKGEIKEWSLFKKYPDAEILPLNKKQSKQPKPKTSKQITPTLSTYQTLFKEQLGAASSNAKQVTKSSVANSNYDKLYSLKTEVAQDSANPLQLQKLRKEHQNALDRLRAAENANRQLRLELIETKCRVAMGDVHRQLIRLASNADKGGIIKINHQAAVEQRQGQDTNGSLVTLKQAFENQFKSNRVHVLVAKFAFRWLNTVRRRKAERKQ